jgi:hypothetical protein
MHLHVSDCPPENADAQDRRILTPLCPLHAGEQEVAERVGDEPAGGGFHGLQDVGMGADDQIGAGIDQPPI